MHVTCVSQQISTSPRVLFLSTENSVRSQMAEALLSLVSQGTIEAVSAGSCPTVVHPYAIHVLAAIGIDISQRQAKHLDIFRHQYFDRVITLCDAPYEACPTFSHGPQPTCWHLAYPVQGTAEERYRAFEWTGLQLTIRIRFLLIFLQREERERAARKEAYSNVITSLSRK